MGYSTFFAVSFLLLGVASAQQVRLLGSVAGIGYVQVQAPNGTWGFICDDCWSLSAARVTCTALGYFGSTGLAESGARAQFLPAVADPIIALDDLDCQGNETNLTQCIRNFNDSLWFVSNCNQNELSAVTCVNVPDPMPPGPDPQLDCRSDSMVITYVNPWTIMPANLQNLYVVNGVNYLTIPYNSPNVTIEQSSTEITYTQEVLMVYPTYGTGVTRYRRYDATLKCCLNRFQTVNRTFEPFGNITLKNTTEWEIVMIIYENRMFTTEVITYPYRLMMGAWLNMAVVLRTTDTRLKLVVSRCLAEPVREDMRGPNYIFYNDKCLVDPQTMATYPLSKTRFGFRLQSFVFDNYPQVRLECDAIVCLKTDQSRECDRSCNSAKQESPDTCTNCRKRRDVDEETVKENVYTVFSPVIHIYNASEATTPASVPNLPLFPPNPNDLALPGSIRNRVSLEQPAALVMFLGNAASPLTYAELCVVIPLAAALMTSLGLF